MWSSGCPHIPRLGWAFFSPVPRQTLPSLLTTPCFHPEQLYQHLHLRPLPSLTGNLAEPQGHPHRLSAEPSGGSGTPAPVASFRPSVCYPCARTSPLRSRPHALYRWPSLLPFLSPFPHSLGTWTAGSQYFSLPTSSWGR